MFGDPRLGAGPTGAAPTVEQWIRTPDSKVRPPVTQMAVVLRNRLLDRLAAARFQILAVEAPAGFGKSTLATQFAEQSVVSAWATLDDTDSDPLVLVSTLLSALDRGGVLPEGTPRDWTDRVSSDEPSFFRFVVPRLRRIIESLSPVTLVLDQVDQASSPQARSLLTALVDSLPPGSSVAILGRSLRTLPLALWRGQGRLVMLTATDLLLDEDEITRALRGFQGRVPDGRYVREVAMCTEGWPVAVYLGAISERYPAAGSADLHEYLDAEVLARVDPQVVDFLRRTSPLEVLSAPACSAVLHDRTGVAELLSKAEQSSLLVRAIQGESRSFHVHALLREHLLNQLADRDPAGLRVLHARAGDWYREQHLIDQATTHARLSGDADLLGRTLWPAAADALLLGQGGRVRRWLDPIADDVLARSAALSLTAAWTAVSYTDPESTARWSDVTLQLLGPESATQLHASSVEPAFALLVTLSGQVAWAEAAQLAKAAQNAFDADSLLRVFGMLVHGTFAVMAGDVETGAAVLHTCRGHAASRALWTTWIESAALLAVTVAQSGDTQRGADLAREAHDTWQQHDREGALSTTAIVHACAATVACLRHDPAGPGHLAVALDLLPRVERVLPWLGVIIHAAAARCSAGTDQDAAADHLRKSDKMLRSLPASPFLGECLADARQAVIHERHIAVLSPAERRVWNLLQTRMTLREIADQLFLSSETVKSHTAAIYRKLGVSTRREAQELAERLGPIVGD